MDTKLGEDEELFSKVVGSMLIVHPASSASDFLVEERIIVDGGEDAN